MQKTTITKQKENEQGVTTLFAKIRESATISGMGFHERFDLSPEQNLNRKERGSRDEGTTFEDLAPDYARQAKAALEGTGPAATLARNEIALAKLSLDHVTKEPIAQLERKIAALNPSVLETMRDDDERERLAFTLALAKAHKTLLQ